MYIYIYIERERERYAHMLYTYICIHTCVGFRTVGVPNLAAIVWYVMSCGSMS